MAARRLAEGVAVHGSLAWLSRGTLPVSASTRNGRLREVTPGPSFFRRPDEHLQRQSLALTEPATVEPAA